ncbi:unnamed protein product [Vitrella brassicaformis CCMP3155]|uniref:Uncharacterized protein n=1 Tax=Vitrella brassicaformis (strain CCMP3155) TaxID=1169540 RepID=A0A0G4F9S8_VITBC|nr:unnamed protein product [Vitrella brassicaformis CCMP3155]|eukprot:CEM09712.1 unnamed protein product [Vitrella brassicaformis CCMP3155]
MDVNQTRLVALRVREQLLPQREFTPLITACLQMNQTQANTQITRLSQMDSTELPAQMVAKVNRQLAAVSDHLAELAHIIETVMTQTTHEGGGSGDSAAQSNDGHVQATPTDLSDLPAEPISTIVAASDVKTIGRFKSTARHFTNAVRPIVRSLRLPKAIERAGVGGVVQFDDQLGDADVMKAMWVAEEGGEGGWGEMADTLRVAEHCGNCQLPIIVNAGDLQTHASKTDFLALPRVFAQWMLVGRNVAFRRPTGQQDGTLELLRHNNEVRIIRNEPSFPITINPPLPQPTGPVHPFSQHPFIHHAKPHDPPVRHRIRWQPGVGWATVDVDDAPVHASASSMVKGLMVAHRVMGVSGFTDSPTVAVDRGVRGGYLDSIRTRSPHTPLGGCSDVTAWEAASGTCAQGHVLMTTADPFIACMIWHSHPNDYQNVHVYITISEAPTAGVPHDAPFARRFPLTASRIRRVASPIAPLVLDG